MTALPRAAMCAHRDGDRRACRQGTTLAGELSDAHEGRLRSFLNPRRTSFGPGTIRICSQGGKPSATKNTNKKPCCEPITRRHIVRPRSGGGAAIHRTGPVVAPSGERGFPAGTGVSGMPVAEEPVEFELGPDLPGLLSVGGVPVLYGVA